ncbi:ATP-binding protein [Massilia sp. TWP1-3-3]|uniref:ATP-binding protein n=1 Tax=Massilia sp. TWP1-3-3 TaxID=2804573 RepID=UPI003CEC0797
MTSSTYTIDEAKRLAVLDGYSILDTPAEKAFDDIVNLLSELLNAPIAAVNLIAEGRQWFKAEVGLHTREMPLENSICRFALLQEDRMIIPDLAQDARMCGNVLVTGAPGLRFYAGAVLKTAAGVPLGTLCVLDVNPRPSGLSARECFILETFAEQIMARMELKKALAEQQQLLARQQIILDELKLERDQSQQLLEGMDEGFIFLDQAFRVRQINPGGLRFETRTADQILGRSHWDIWPGSEDLPLAQHYKKAMRERQKVAFENHYVYPDGRNFWVEVRAFPANDGLAVFYRDVTARKMAEIALRETADRLEFSLQAAQIGDWDLNLADDTAYRSLRHDQCFGYTAPIAHWGFATFIEHVHPDDRTFVSEQFANALRELKDWNFECRVTWPDQTSHWIAAHGSVYGRDATPTRMSGIVFEITSRKHAEETLRESQRLALIVARSAENERRRLDALLEAVPVGIIVANAAGSLVQVNAENRRLWGNHPMSADIDAYVEWKGWWADGSHRHGQALQPSDWAMTRALAGEAAPRQIIEIEPFDQPGQRRVVLNSGAPIRGDDGEIVGAIVAQMDVTDRIRAEEALRQADQKKDEFLAMLAHELRNPLAPITSAAAILAARNIDAITVRRASTIIARQAKHMTSLIDDLLDVSRVTRGKVELEHAQLDAKDVIADAIEQVRPLIEKHHHRLGVHLSPDPSILVGDRKRLVQVMTNLLSNAAKYTPNGGNIDIALECGADTLTITVRDDGIGMTAELIGSAFELFSQGTRGLDRSQGGLGIGLALVKSLVHLHNGTVSARSDGADKGSVLEVKLPRSNLAMPALDTARYDEARPMPALRIAIVDDNEDAATTLALFLQSFGHEVCTVLSATDAIARFPSFRPDVCLLDIGLPEMNGFDLARALRSALTTAGTVLIAVTGYAQERDRQEALAAGFDDLFAKPVDLAALNTTLMHIAHLRARTH